MEAFRKPLHPLPKVLVICLDSANPDLLKKWASDGSLPNLYKLMESGTSGKVKNEPGLSSAVWPTFYTGVSAANHGYYFYNQLVPGTYEMKIRERGQY